MDNRQNEYQQPGSSETIRREVAVQTDPYPAEHNTAPQYPQAQDPRAAPNYSSSTPTSEYMPPSSARSGQFPEYMSPQQPRGQYPPPGQGPPTGGLAQPPSPSLQHPMANGQQKSSDMKSNHHVPIDPSIATSPSYPPPQPSPYSPYQPHPGEMQHYGGQPGVYGRPEWAAGHHYAQGPPSMHHPYGHAVTSGPPSAGLVSPVYRPMGGHPISTVYSFVPIPGAQQHKRPRRRYEEIERMYKCGWQGCEKAYGTLNHLNAHVTMQSHGQKRTPEEFKEIRKEWKQKKKEEEAARKADDDRHRQAVENRAPPDGPSMGGPQLPPIGYAPPVSGQSQPGYGAPSPAIVDGMQQYVPVQVLSSDDIFSELETIDATSLDGQNHKK